MAGWIEAVVSHLECGNHDHRSAYLAFCGDMDMVTLGIASLTSTTANEIVVAEMLPTELGDEAGHAFEDRINQILERSDLHYVRLLRVDQPAQKSGTSFAQFRAAYCPPRLIYACPHCGADSPSVGAESPSAFQISGGIISNLTEIELRG